MWTKTRGDRNNVEPFEGRELTETQGLRELGATVRLHDGDGDTKERVYRCTSVR